MTTVIFKKVSYTVKGQKVNDWVMGLIGGPNEQFKQNLLIDKPYAKNIRISKTNYNGLCEKIKP
jgi:hypothetical protein